MCSRFLRSIFVCKRKLKLYVYFIFRKRDISSRIVLYLNEGVDIFFNKKTARSLAY